MRRKAAQAGKAEHSHLSAARIYAAGHFLRLGFLPQRQRGGGLWLVWQSVWQRNSEGAFLAESCIAQELQARGLLPDVVFPSLEDFLWCDLVDEHRYLGNLNRRLSYLFSTQEAITYFSSGDQPVARAEIVARGLDEYELDYNTISTDNLGFYRVCNPDARSATTALVLKDSMENTMTDYLTALFSELIVIDPRSYAEPYPFDELLAHYDVDLVLFVYHDHNVSQELRQFLNR